MIKFVILRTKTVKFPQNLRFFKKGLRYADKNLVFRPNPYIYIYSCWVKIFIILEFFWAVKMIFDTNTLSVSLIFERDYYDHSDQS